MNWVEWYTGLALISVVSFVSVCAVTAAGVTMRIVLAQKKGPGG